MEPLRSRWFNHATSLRWDTLRGYAITVLAVAGVTAVLAPLRDRLGLLNVGLLFLMLVILLAARWGWGPALFASVAANLAFNFFFVPPLHTFTVRGHVNIVALLVFLFAAALTSFLLARAQNGEAQARRRAQETAVLYELSRLIIVTPSTADTLARVCERVRQTFAVESCAVLLPRDGRLVRVVSSGPGTSFATAYEQGAAAEAFAGGATVFLSGQGRRRPRIVGVPDRRMPIVDVPLRVGAQTVGVLEVAGTLAAQVFTEDELRLLEAFADITALAVDRGRLLREATRAEALEEADQLKSAVLATVSHDLRTPLTTIVASVSSLLQSDVRWDDATRRQFLVQIEEQSLRLTRLVDNLLDLSRIEGGALRPDRDWYDVSELLEDVLASTGIEEQRHTVRLEIATGTGNARFDRIQIEQVLHNLIENAVKFSSTDTVIRIFTRRLDGVVEIGVADQGPGIPAAERERVFEKFYRMAGVAPRTRGAGLGLAICKGFVEANGGRIRVEEAAGGGACFVITLPAAPGAVAAVGTSG